LKKNIIKRKIISGKYNPKFIHKQRFLLIKIKIIIIFISSIYLSKYLSFSSKTEIIIDNSVKFDKENNIDFSPYSTTIKPIAIYNIKIEIKKSRNN